MKYRIIKKKINHSYIKVWIKSYVDWMIAESQNNNEDTIKICINYEKWDWDVITTIGKKLNLRNKDIKKYALYRFYKYLI